MEKDMKRIACQQELEDFSLTDRSSVLVSLLPHIITGSFLLSTGHFPFFSFYFITNENEMECVNKGKRKRERNGSE